MTIEMPWRFVDTPDVNERGFVTVHDPDILGFTSATGNDAWPIEGVTLYQNWFAREEGRVSVWGNYVLSNFKVGEDGRLLFFWGKNKTEAEKNTPYKIKPSSKLMGWDPVLKGFRPYPDYGTVRSSRKILSSGVEALGNAPEYFAEISYIAGGEYSTRFIRYDYYAATKFNIPAYQCPVPTAVIIMLPGREAISFPRCLHKKMTMPRFITSSALSADGEGQAAGGSTEGQVFPSTAPFEQWGAWTVEHDQEQLAAGWHAWKIVAYPPAEPETTIQKF